MGYHIILNSNENRIKTIYVKDLKDLLDIEGINEDSIICQGEEQCKPIKLTENEEYAKYAKEWYRAGLKAQRLFKKQASDERFILEEISQDIESFKNYTSNATTPIKRSDFIVRDLNMVEVEVKCRTFYGSKSNLFFYFSLDEFEKHKGMTKTINTKIVIAIYQRHEDSPIEESLRMIHLDEIISNFESFNIKNHPDKNVGKALEIPISKTTNGFQLLHAMKKGLK